MYSTQSPEKREVSSLADGHKHYSRTFASVSTVTSHPGVLRPENLPRSTSAPCSLAVAAGQAASELLPLFPISQGQLSPIAWYPCPENHRFINFAHFLLL